MYNELVKGFTPKSGLAAWEVGSGTFAGEVVLIFNEKKKIKIYAFSVG